MEPYEKMAARNQERAREIITELDIEGLWKSYGARINLVGSLRTGLLVKHHDIDFHIYSSPLTVEGSFSVAARLAENPRVQRIEYINGIHTEEKCIEWHAWYRDRDDELWQIDMIHILEGSFYDGYFEHFADRLEAVLTPETRQAILRIKYDQPDDEKIAGVEIYHAVVRHGIRSYPELAQWRTEHPLEGVLHWIP